MVDVPPSSGDTCADLVAILKDFAGNFERVNRMVLIGTCLAEETPHSRTGRPAARADHPAPWGLVRQVLEGARDTGEIRADADLEAAVSALLGSFFADYLARSGQSRPWISPWRHSAHAARRPGEGAYRAT